MKLTTMQRKFCHYHFELDNGTAAAVKAGYSKKTADVKASQLLLKPQVRQYMSRMYKKQLKKFDVTGERIARELCCIAFANPLDMYTDEGQLKKMEDIPQHALRAISHIETVTEANKPGETKHLTRLRMHPKILALERLSKMLGFEEPEKEHTEMEITIKYA